MIAFLLFCIFLAILIPGVLRFLLGWSLVLIVASVAFGILWHYTGSWEIALTLAAIMGFCTLTDKEAA